MKKIITTSLILLFFLTIPTVALSQVEPAPEIDVVQALQNTVNWLFGILLIVAAIFLVIAAYHFVTSQGDPEKVKTARNFVLYTLIGVAVGVAARGLVSLVQWIFNV